MYNRNKPKHQKEPSLRDSLLGKQPVSKLPNNFFENVLDCELRLKQKFSMNLLQDLISYYTTAIEYFESIDDPRYKQYNQNLNLLFTQPEVIRAMNGKKFEKKAKKEEILQKLENSEKGVTNQKVQNIIKVTKQNHLKEKINEEVDNQLSNFEKKKAEKKKKYLLSTSDITDAVMTMKNRRNHNNNQNKSVDLALNDKDKNDDVVVDTTNILGELNNPNVNETTKKKLNSKIKMNMDVYFNEYFEYFIDKIVPNIVNDYEAEFEKKSKKECENGINYSNQVKEMEFLLTSDADQSYKEQIGKIIFQLEEEEKVENEKIENAFTESFKTLDEKYLGKYANDDIGINLMQEKLKLDMCNTLSNTVIDK